MLLYTGGEHRPLVPRLIQLTRYEEALRISKTRAEANPTAKNIEEHESATIAESSGPDDGNVDAVADLRQE